MEKRERGATGGAVIATARKVALGVCVALALGLLVLVGRLATAPARVKAAWHTSYPELCSRQNIQVSPMASMSLWSYRLKCEVHPPTMDYANPVVIVDIWRCTAVTYLPNLTLPAVYLSKFSSPQRMPVCP
jgi:hypothetical protein